VEEAIGNFLEGDKRRPRRGKRFIRTTRRYGMGGLIVETKAFAFIF
jgi:hypothetical protein